MKITVYTTDPCVQCNLTKNLMDRKGLAYDVVKLQDVPELVERFKDEGLMQAPVVVLGDDGRRWSGFRPDLIEELADAGVAE